MYSYTRLGQSTWYCKKTKQKKTKKKTTDLLIIHKPNLTFSHFIKTYKWTKEIRGPKSNSPELLCLSWLPATLLIIRSKMNELAWRHHFFIISLWEIFQTSRAATSLVSGPIWRKFELVRNVMHVLVTCRYKRIGSKTTEKKQHHFPHYKSMGISVTMETRVLI